MSLAAETRLNMLFNDLFHTYEAMTIVGQAICSWAKALFRYLECFYAIMVNLMLFTCLGAKIWFCAPVGMSLAAETRLNMLFNDTFITYEAMKVVGHALCPWAKALVRYFEWFYVIVVNLTLFACLGAKTWLCPPASMPPAAKTRPNMLFYDILKTCEATKSAGHALGPCVMSDVR